MKNYLKAFVCLFFLIASLSPASMAQRPEGQDPGCENCQDCVDEYNECQQPTVNCDADDFLAILDDMITLC